MARKIFHGHSGELRQPYRQGQEDQLGALGLVLNAIAKWNTRYMAAALDYLRSTEGHVNTEDVERLSPLRHDHINLHGRYHFTPSDAVTSRRRTSKPSDIDRFSVPILLGAQTRARPPRPPPRTHRRSYGPTTKHTGRTTTHH